MQSKGSELSLENQRLWNSWSLYQHFPRYTLDSIFVVQGMIAKNRVRHMQQRSKRQTNINQHKRKQRC